jgi:16S rRNA (adenine1518-N6/adenine1519-N6)-dimethyltransferase
MNTYSSLLDTTRHLLSSFNLHPKKRLGQNFLIDESVLKRIINAADISKEDVVLEIGTGLGVLTQALAQKAKHVITLDPDKDMILIAKQVLAGYKNIDFVAADFLDWEPAGHFNKVVANVPYYITSPIIEKILSFKDKSELAVLTVQKEVAERLAASPGSKAFGSFTVFVQNRAKVKIDFFISKKSFYPSPDVDSAILVLKPYGKLLYNMDEKIVRAAFSQRRKMIRSSLSKFNIDFSSIGIDPRRRPETLSLEEFEKISKF